MINSQSRKAIRYLVDMTLNADGSQRQLETDKPLVMHSLYVGYKLFEYGYDKELVTAGIYTTLTKVPVLLSDRSKSILEAELLI